MIVRYFHPGHGAVVEAQFDFTCPACLAQFVEPAENELQQEVGDAIEVHCIECGAHVRTWVPPDPSPPPEPEPEPDPS